MGKPLALDKCCANCRYLHGMPTPTSDPEAEDGIEYDGGECRKRAPVIGTGQWADQDVAPWAYWPTVAPGHWCGDFRWSRRTLADRLAALPDAKPPTVHTGGPCPGGRWERDEVLGLCCTLCFQPKTTHA